MAKAIALAHENETGIGIALGEAAAALEIARSTAKTHLARMFSKTGTSRQAEIVALVHRLVPPVRL